ncbi:signal recognition particle-docking protein FtsY [Candidatus Woesearchaeota archaeon]|nr:signal recognition particle-docking protein FtsY [Candidatus Woesearchaeota archaeon]
MHYDKEFYEKSQKTYEKNFEDAKKEILKHPTKKVHEYPIKKIEKKSVTEEAPKIVVQKEESKKGFFATITEKITTTKIDTVQFEKLFWDLQLALMENNVAIEVIEQIKNDLKGQLVDKPIRRTKVEDTVATTLKNSIERLFQGSNIDLIDEINNKKEKPYVIAFFGINGSGKTTSIAKIASMLKGKNISCVLAASDTFRAASIEQLQQHADKIGIKMIKHDYGSDPAAVAFDAIKHAKAKSIDVVLIDTAGRMHSNINLIDEMKKIIRVAKPDLKIFVGESITGNDCVEQAKTFNEAVGIDGIILAKADIDEKGGAAVSVSYVTKKPILFLGTGQKYGDLEAFESEVIIRNLGLA